MDPSKFGVSLDRINRELGEAEDPGQRGDAPLRLEFHVQVYGTAPKIDLLQGFPLVGPLPYGAPTHREVIDFLTPEEFRSPPIPFEPGRVGGPAAVECSKKQQCEAELEEYKRW